MKYLFLTLPLAACTPHVERCITVPLPYDCESGGGSGLLDLAGGVAPPKPDQAPAPAPEPPAPDPKPDPKPEPDPKPPKPDHDDDDDDHDHDDDRKRDKKRGHDDD